MTLHLNLKDSRGKKHGHHAWRLVVGALVGLAATLIISVAVDLPSAHANGPVPGGTYEGDFDVGEDADGTPSGGGTIQIVVSPDGQGISSITISTFVNYCDIIDENLTFDPPLPIDANGDFDTGFQTGPDAAPLFVGLAGFFSDSTVDGAIAVVSGDPQCDQDVRFFSATLVAPPPATPTPAALPSLPSVGIQGTAGGVSGSLWAMVAGLLATVGAGLAVYGSKYARSR